MSRAIVDAPMICPASSLMGETVSDTSTPIAVLRHPDRLEVLDALAGGDASHDARQFVAIVVGHRAR